MADAKDILGLRQDGPPKGKAKVSKEPVQRKPEGVSREVRAAHIASLPFLQFLHPFLVSFLSAVWLCIFQSGMC